MNKPVKIAKIGNSSGVIFSREMLTRLGVGPGDMLTPFFTENGVEFRRTDSDFEVQMAAAREVMARRKRALRELAK